MRHRIVSVLSAVAFSRLALGGCLVVAGWAGWALASRSAAVASSATTIKLRAGDPQQATANPAQTDTTASDAAMQDFNARCNAPGVVLCQGFDDPSGFLKNVNIFPSADYPTAFPAMDATTGRSGKSLRIDVPPRQGGDMGKFYTGFTGIGRDNTDFYFQVATRISPEMLKNYANSEKTGWPTWKNHAFFNGGTSCTGMSVVTGLQADGLIPISTSNCSARGFFTNGGVPPYLLQQGDYKCQYRGESPRSCFYWPTNTWITFYYHVHLGSYNSSSDNYDNTSVEAWVATDGKPYKQWLNIPKWGMGANNHGKWDHVELYPYMTGKDKSKDYPEAHVWYDELIISTKPIAAPQVPPAAP